MDRDRTISVAEAEPAAVVQSGPYRGFGKGARYRCASRDTIRGGQDTQTRAW